MTARRVHGGNDNYMGYSSDVKPTSNVGNGAFFTEIDTGAKYIFYDGQWEDDLTLIYAFSQAIKQH